MRILPLALAAAMFAVAGTASAATQTDNLDITVELVNECFMMVQDHTASHTGLTASVNTTGGDISVSCNLDTVYTLEIAQGNSYGLGTRPAMRAISNGTGNFISYEIWSNAGFSTPWGTAANGVSGVGTGQFVAHSYFLSFYDMNLAPGGTYGDSPVVTLTYN